MAVSLTQTGTQAANCGPNHADLKGWCARILDAFGSSSADFLSVELSRIMNAVGATGEAGEAKVNAALAVLDGLKPRNEIEAMLGSQMAVTHALAMEVLGRARRVQDIAQFDSAANAASKLLRTYLLQVEALVTMRRGGKQEVRVVHVHAGAQAVVGNVTSHPRMGGGGSKKNDRTRALAHAPGTPMRSPDKIGEAVPTTGNGKAALPDARRGQG